MALVDVDERIPESARRALSILVDQIEDLEVRIESSEKVILATARDNEVCRPSYEGGGYLPIRCHRLGGVRRSSSTVRLGQTFCGLAWVGTEAALDGGKGAFGRHQ